MKNIKTFQVFENHHFGDDVAEYFYDFTDNRTIDEKFNLISTGNSNGKDYIIVDFGKFHEDKYDMFIDCLTRFHEATGYRPVSFINTKHRNNNDLNTIEKVYEAKLLFFICDDSEYERICNFNNKEYMGYHMSTQENIRLQKIFKNEKH